MISLLREFFVPSFCWYCRGPRQEEPLCGSCMALVKPILASKIGSLTIHAASSYDEPLKSLILAKHYRAHEVTSLLAPILWQCSVIKAIPADFLIPVPLHSYRQLARGYNQALLLAQELSRLSGIPVLDCVRRNRNTTYQAQTGSTTERYKNVSNAFTLKPEASLCTNKEVVLIDDLMTSGATLSAVANLLREKEPAKIQAVVACRVITDN